MASRAFGGREFGKWELDDEGGFSIMDKEGDMGLLYDLSQTFDHGEEQINMDILTTWFCTLGMQQWSNPVLQNEIPEVNMYLMLLMYCKIAFSPLKLIRKFVFPESSSGSDCRYTNKVQLETSFKRSRVTHTGHLYIFFESYGPSDGANFHDMVHDQKHGLLALHSCRKLRDTARFEPNDAHVMCTDTFAFIRPLVYPEADAVYLASGSTVDDLWFKAHRHLPRLFFVEYE